VERPRQDHSCDLFRDEYPAGSVVRCPDHREGVVLPDVGPADYRRNMQHPVQGSVGLAVWRNELSWESKFDL
jgi:hypothetical protein